MPTPITAQQLRDLGWNYEELAIKRVTFDRYGRASSDMRFTSASALVEYDRLTRLGYSVGLLDMGAEWNRQTVAQLVEKNAERRAALAAI